MQKIIIENRTAEDMLTAIGLVKQVIAMGRISNDGQQYCYHTEFDSGLHVSAYLNKQSDRFVVWQS